MNINRQIDILLIIYSKKRNISSISLNEFSKYVNGVRNRSYCLTIITRKKKNKEVYEYKNVEWFNSKIKLLEWLIGYGQENRIKQY